MYKNTRQGWHKKEDDVLDEIDGVKEKDKAVELLGKDFARRLRSMTNTEQELAARLLSRIERNPETGCLEWQGRTQNGYGVLQIAKRSVLAHRLSYAVFKGSIGIGLHVCHACDNPGCIHPGHLWIGTHQENMRDASLKRRHNRGLDLHRPTPTQFHQGIADDDFKWVEGESK